MTDQLHERLESLAMKIDGKITALKIKNSWHDGHLLSATELKERYAFLRDKVDGQVTDLENNEHHVSALERKVLIWIDEVDA